MKFNSIMGGLCFFVVFITVLFNCFEDNPVSDAKKTAALRKVTISYDSMICDVELPQGALSSGKTFDELVAEDSVKYSNPANYTITFFLNMTADNTKEDADDAKFDGMDVDMVMDTIESSPVETSTGEFEVDKNTSLPVQTQGTINLETHRLTGLYIFRQIVDGNDLATTLKPFLDYKIGSLEGTIDIPDIQQDIPTRASDEMKAFLSGLLDSGVFE